MVLTSGLVAACVAAVCGLLWKRPVSADRLGTLKSVYADLPQRPVLRLNAFPYVPPSRRTRGAPHRGDEELQAAALNVLRDPSDRHAVAIANLLLGRQREAVTILQLAVRRDAGRPELWNDLGVALHELGRLENDPETIAMALMATDRALRIAPAMPDAIFNRAAILDDLGLSGPAALARRHYLGLDPDSKWADEARDALVRERAERKARPRWEQTQSRMESAVANHELATVDEIIRTFPQDVRAWCERDLLVQWAKAEVEGRYEDGQRAMTIAGIASERLMEITGEGLALAAWEAARSAADAKTLAEAYVAYDQARELAQQRRTTAAEPLLALAEHGFDRAGSPLALVARYYRAGATFDQRRTEQALALLDETEAKSRPEHKSLRAHCLWERSRILGRIGRRYESLRLAIAAADQFQRIGAVGPAGRNRIEIASRMTWFGRSTDAWRIRRGVFEECTESRLAGLLQLALYTAGRDELAMGRNDLARSLLAMIEPAAIESPPMRFDALLWRTYLELQSEDAGEAPAKLAELRSNVQTIADPAFRQDADDQLAFAEALLVRKIAPARTLDLLTEAITFREKTNRPARSAEAYLERGRVNRDLQRDEAAEHDFAAALIALEHQRAEVGPTDLRDSFFDVARGTCEELLRLQAKRGAFSEAFHTIERCRARSLLDAVTGHDANNVSTMAEQEISRRLDDRTLIATYASMGDKLLLLLISARGLEAFTLPVAPEEIAQRNSELIAAVVEHNPSVLRLRARALYDALIGPFEQQLDSVTTLVISGDESMAGLPFALLKDSRNRRLVERAEIAVALSVSLYVHHSTARSQLLDAGARTLVIGDPTFDRAVGGDLPTLPSAEEEGRRIGALYLQTIVLLRGEATSRRFLAEVPRADLIHVATHAVAHPRTASASFLLFAPDGGDSGVIYLPTIANLRLPNAPLVILAGCRTGAASGGTGAIRSLASAFLAAGSRGVVGTLWNVDDELTVPFSIALHRHLREHRRLSAAVRAAQLEMTRSGDPRLRDAAAWASFVSYGF